MAAGHRVTVVVGADEILVQRWLGGRGWEVIPREGPVNGGADIASTAAIAARDDACVVVDGYDFYGGLLEALSAAGARVCAIDDLYQAVAPAFAVVNHNLYADARRYEGVAPPARVLAGPAFALVRDEFLAAREARLQRERSGARVLVTMGGSDPAGATPIVLEGLERLAPDVLLDIDVVVGLANPLLSQLELATSVSRHRVQILPATDRMGALLAAADLVITAGGTTCLEIACVGVPALVVAIADNQRLVHDAMDRFGLGLGLGWHADLVPAALANAALGLLGDAKTRDTMSSRQRALVDGQGKHRVVAALAR